MQHGEKIQGKGATELGYFIAKIQDTYMKSYLDEFDKQYKGKKNIDIEIFDENPLSIKYARYNQTGEVCHCNQGSSMANLKTKDGFKQIQCNENCEHRQKNQYGKSACNRIAWFKFLIPSISKDRIFLMRITGQTSISRLNDYFNLQKIQGKSVKGTYTIYLKQVEQSNSLGKVFNNYILDIMPKNNFNSNNIPPQITEKSTKNQQNVSSTVESQETQLTATKSETTEKKTKSKSTTKKTTADKKDSEDKKTGTEEQNKESDDNNDFKNCYCLLNTFNKDITDKHGNVKNYLVGNFADMQDTLFDIVIRPEDAEELSKCSLGTFVRLETKEILGNIFALKLEYIDKKIEKVAA